MLTTVRHWVNANMMLLRLTTKISSQILQQVVTREDNAYLFAVEIIRVSEQTRGQGLERLVVLVHLEIELEVIDSVPVITHTEQTSLHLVVN